MLRSAILLGFVLVANVAAQDRGSARAADSVEAAVLRAVLRHMHAEPGNYVFPAPRWPLCSASTNDANRTACVPDSLRVEFDGAVADYFERQARRDTLSEGTLSQLGLERADSLTGSGSNSCTEPTVYVLSPVGLDVAKTHAVVGAAVFRGPTPQPSRCGFGLGVSLLLRRAATGEWVVVATVNGWRA